MSEHVHVRMTRLAAIAVAAVSFALASCGAVAQRGTPQIYDDFVFAVLNDRVDQVRQLLARGMDPNTVDPKGDPVLVVAARGGNRATVDALIAARANVNQRNSFGDTPLLLASLHGHLDIVRALRKAGAELDPPGWTPLIYAATGGHDGVVRYLLDEGAKINAQSPNGTTALMMAVRESRFSTVELLLARGADVNHRNENGATALEWAEKNDDASMARRLRRAGAR